MSVGNRVLLRAFALLVFLGAIWVVLLLAAVEPAVAATQFIVTEGVGVAVYLVVVLAIAVRFLAFPLILRSTHAFVRDTGVGEIRIAHGTVRELARRAAMQVRGVERLQTHIQEDPAGLVVYLSVRATPSADLNAMSEQLQQVVSEVIRGSTSLAVSAVHVHVAGIASQEPTR